MYELRVVVADADPESVKDWKQGLIRAGYVVVGEANDGHKALQILFQLRPDVAIIDAELPGRRALQVARVASEQRLCAVVLAIRAPYNEIMEAIGEAGVSACLIKPASEANLIAAVETAYANYTRLLRLEQEKRRAEEQLATRKVIERAKGIIMERMGLSEAEAYQYLRRLSMDRCIPMGELAKAILRNGGPSQPTPPRK
ncbi:MAG: ANTAR domain-containing protein [Clostridia bacterium]|nr:ANTAR domain-containing protein [Clostridia bacterium]